MPVGPEGEVTTWTISGDRAFALVKLDGADTALLHLFLGSKVQTGMRVRARFSENRKGQITDIQGFEPL